jgi:hypothetical protein
MIEKGLLEVGNIGRKIELMGLFSIIYRTYLTCPRITQIYTDLQGFK